MKIKIFNREICVCALLATNSLIHSWICTAKQRRNEGNNESSIYLSFGNTCGGN